MARVAMLERRGDQMRRRKRRTFVWFGNGTELRYKLYPEPLADVLKLDLCGVRVVLRV